MRQGQPPRKTRLGPRQARILAGLHQLEAATGRTVFTTIEIAKAIAHPHLPVDIEVSLVGMVERGLVARCSTGRERGSYRRWQMTQGARRALFGDTP